ncbi:MAG: DUF1559 domain-containing protein [Planctomycetes bacterium]|nr:DUF1559 domain-containing protein [Planctomycetota bacterium]
MSVRNRRGFTLVELLVVISIIGMLMALLIPAVQQARETARGNTCRNNLTNLVKAIINYEGTTQSYPGYQQTIKSRTGIEMQVGWLVPILRQLDRPDMDNSIRSFAGPVDPSLGVLSHPFWQPYCELRRQQGDSAYPDPSFLEILLCPSDASRTKQGQVSHYVVNTGRRDSPVGLQNNLDIPLDFPDNGVFQASGRLYLDFGGPQSTITTPTGSFSGVTLNLGKNARKIGSGFISRGDGLSTTLMLSENVAAHDWTDIEERQTGFIWWPYEVPDDATNAQIADLSMIKINGKLGQEPTPHEDIIP